MFCRFCGKESETPVCPQCAAAEQAPVTQPEAVPAAPEETVPTVLPEEAPASFPEEAAPTDEPLMELGLNEEPKKKKSKKPLWIILTALVAVVALLVVLFWSTIVGWFRYATSDPAEWMQEVEMETAKSANGAVASLYGALIKGDGLNLGNFNTAATTVNLQLSQTLLSMVTGLIPNADQLPFDLNKLQNLSVTTKFTVTEDMVHLLLSADGQLDLHAYADIPNSKLYLQLPQAQEQALCFDLKAMSGVDLAQMKEQLLSMYSLDNPSVAESSFSALILGALGNQTFKDAMPSEDEFQGMLDRFAEAMLTPMTQNAEKSQETVTVGDASENQYVLSTTINESTLRQMIKAVLTTAKDDATVKKILDAVSAYATENGKAVDLHSMVSLMVPSLIAEMDTPIDDFGTITLNTYLNNDNEVVGRSVLLTGFDDEAISLSYNVVDDGDTDYYEVRVPELTISGTITEEDDTTTTVINLPIDKAVYQFTIKSAPNKCSVRFTPPSELTAQLVSELVNNYNVPSALLHGLSLELAFETPSANQGKISVGLLSGETYLVSVGLSETLSTEIPVRPGDVMDATDGYSLAKWVIKVDHDGLVAALTNLGLKEEFATSLIDQLLQEAINELT